MSEVSKLFLSSQSNLLNFLFYFIEIDLQRSLLDVKHDGKVGLDWLRRWHKLVGLIPDDMIPLSMINFMAFNNYRPVGLYNTVGGRSFILLSLSTRRDCDCK